MCGSESGVEASGEQLVEGGSSQLPSTLPLSRTRSGSSTYQRWDINHNYGVTPQLLS